MTRRAALTLFLVLALLVHVDWHVARPEHIHRSLGWSGHWVLGALAFGLIGWLAGRSSKARAGELVGLSLAALFVGHLVEATGEMLVYSQPWSVVMPQIRWRIFAEFCFAGTITGVAAFAAAR